MQTHWAALVQVLAVDADMVLPMVRGPQMRTKVLLALVVLVVFITMVQLTMPITAKNKVECDERGGFYDYKSTACWSNGGYEVLGWK
jgi:hypothetical protein